MWTILTAWRARLGVGEEDYACFTILDKFRKSHFRLVVRLDFTAKTVEVDSVADFRWLIAGLHLLSWRCGLFLRFCLGCGLFLGGWCSWRRSWTLAELDHAWNWL